VVILTKGEPSRPALEHSVRLCPRAWGEVIVLTSAHPDAPPGLQLFALLLHSFHVHIVARQHGRFSLSKTVFLFNISGSVTALETYYPLSDRSPYRHRPPDMDSSTGRLRSI
jgi:hypothetical protein